MFPLLHQNLQSIYFLLVSTPHSHLTSPHSHPTSHSHSPHSHLSTLPPPHIPPPHTPTSPHSHLSTTACPQPLAPAQLATIIVVPLVVIAIIAILILLTLLLIFWLLVSHLTCTQILYFVSSQLLCIPVPHSCMFPFSHFIFPFSRTVQKCVSLKRSWPEQSILRYAGLLVYYVE